MRRAWLALSSLVFALTLPAYAGGGHTNPSASSAPVKPPPPAASVKPIEDTFAAEVLILHATNEKKGIDPRIGKLPELAKAPFSTYDSYELVDRARLHIKGGVRVDSADGAAGRAGVQEGDVILAISNIQVSSVKQFIATVAKLDKTKSIAVLVRRGDSANYLVIRPSK